MKPTHHNEYAVTLCPFNFGVAKTVNPNTSYLSKLVTDKLDMQLGFIIRRFKLYGELQLKHLVFYRRHSCTGLSRLFHRGVRITANINPAFRRLSAV
jgi:ribosomal protein L35